MDRALREAPEGCPGKREGALFPESPAELLEVHGVHGEHVNVADGERSRPGNVDPEEASRRDDVILRGVRGEELEGGDSLVAVLDLVEEEQGVSRRDLAAEKRLQRGDDGPGVEVCGKGRLETRLFVEVYVDDVRICPVRPSKVQDRRGLSRLARAKEDQGLLVGSSGPGLELCGYLAPHGVSLGGGMNGLMKLSPFSEIFSRKNLRFCRLFSRRAQTHLYIYVGVRELGAREFMSGGF